jgi:hypothetical protein
MRESCSFIFTTHAGGLARIRHHQLYPAQFFLIYPPGTQRLHRLRRFNLLVPQTTSSTNFRNGSPRTSWRWSYVHSSVLIRAANVIQRGAFPSMHHSPQLRQPLRAVAARPPFPTTAPPTMAPATSRSIRTSRRTSTPNFSRTSCISPSHRAGLRNSANHVSTRLLRLSSTGTWERTCMTSRDGSACASTASSSPFRLPLPSARRYVVPTSRLEIYA